MIFMVPEKAFKKNAKKWLKVRDYLIVDGSDAGSIDDDAVKTDVANTFNNVVINGGFTPHSRLLSSIKKETKDGDISTDKLSWKTTNMMEDFFESPEFVGAALSVIKGFTMDRKEGQINIFVVLPNKVYKCLSDAMLARIYKMMKVDDFQFIFSLTELEERKKLLDKDLKAKKMDQLRERVPKVAKKYKLEKD